MDTILERQAAIRAAYNPTRVIAFQAKLNDLRERFPNQWVVYTDQWHEDRQDYTFAVQGPFISIGEAVAWSDTQPDDEREVMTVFFADRPTGGVVRLKHGVVSQPISPSVGGGKSE